ncbi:DEKNAAC102372 [Brettanomyces naardenensis]|uniref:DEKNAAC102372 n=1 Tax=Brettanomyces naardenensis TaxID=13370 RepID=A0A448YKB5_BRENA|nr:DEKNAAC102372 [Brettanomyces naardenensis]
MIDLNGEGELNTQRVQSENRSHSDTVQPSNQERGTALNLYNPVRSALYIIILTLIVGALQLAWSTEFSEATPFLLSLGISKHVLALVWLAGPLSGAIGQPIVGLLSDRCNMAWGRRRVFIMVGMVATLTSLLYLSHCTDIVSWFVNTDDPKKIDWYTIPYACIGVYILDFSIAVIQASARALIVDVVPTSQQQIANAWAARMIGIFNMVGFCFGSANLPRLFPFLGNTQFKVLSVLVTILMGSMTTFCCWYIKERNPKRDITIRMQRKRQEMKLREMGLDPEKSQGLPTQIHLFFAQILRSFKRLPPQIKIVCYTEFFAWVGYFPMLFYTSSYVGELYLYENGYASPDALPVDIKQHIMDESTRRGTAALLGNSVVTLAVDLLMPILVENAALSKRWNRYFNTRTLWIASHAVFIIGMLSTFFVNSSTGAIALFALLGFPWGCAVWIPFVMISEEISRIKDIRVVQIYDQQQKLTSEDHATLDSESDLVPRQSDETHYMDLQQDLPIDAPVLTEKNRIYLAPSLVEFYDNLEHDSGILLAIHNVFVSGPQMLSSVASSFLFKIFGSKGGYDNSLAWVFRFGGIVTIGALALSTQVKTDEQLYEDDEERAKAL